MSDLSFSGLSVAPGSLCLGNPAAFVAQLKDVYRDLQRFNRAGCELVPPSMLSACYLSTFPSLTAPTLDDVDASGHRIYQFIDPTDSAKGITSGSETH